MDKKKVLIIGAGPAGLTAGFELLSQSNDYEVTIVEESGAIGGISRTVPHHGNRMDIGGHRFFSKDPRVMDWWKERLPVQGKPSFDDLLLGRKKVFAENGPDPEKEDRVMLVRNRVSRIYYLNSFFDYPISMKWQTFRNMGFRRTMAGGFSYLKSCMVKKEENSLENFYINRFGRVLYEMFFEGYTEKLWGRHPSQILADWGAQRVKGLSIGEVLKDMIGKFFHIRSRSKETSLIEEFLYPKYGPGQLWESVAEEIESRGGCILKNHEVSRIHCGDNRITGVSCRTDSGEIRLSGDIVLSSMPLRDLVLGLEGKELPQEVVEIARGLPYRDFVTVGLLVDKLKLKNETDIPTLGDRVPDCWIYVQEPDVKLGRIQIFNNWSPYMVENPKETVWIGLEYFCQEGDDFWNMDEESAVAFAVSELESMGIVDRKDVRDTHRERVKKAYPAYFDTYPQIQTLIDYMNGYENLYCIGRNGQHRYNNMDHSMVTAFEAVENILEGETSKENIWKVNTEKDYHEKHS